MIPNSFTRYQVEDKEKGKPEGSEGRKEAKRKKRHLRPSLPRYLTVLPFVRLSTMRQTTISCIELDIVSHDYNDVSPALFLDLTAYICSAAAGNTAGSALCQDGSSYTTCSSDYAQPCGDYDVLVLVILHYNIECFGMGHDNPNVPK